MNQTPAGEVLVVGRSTPFVEAVASELAGLGASVASLDAPTTRNKAIEVFAENADVTAVVHVPSVAGGLSERRFVDTDESAWDREAEEPIRTALLVFQGAYAAMRGRAGSIVVLLPSAALTGAAGLVPFASAAEGIRLLMKSAARAWGRERICLNAVTLPLDPWLLEPRQEHVVPNRFGPSLATADVAADAAAAAAMLIGPLARRVTGATVGADRGTVMAP